MRIEFPKLAASRVSSPLERRACASFSGFSESRIASTTAKLVTVAVCVACAGCSQQRTSTTTPFATSTYPMCVALLNERFITALLGTMNGTLAPLSTPSSSSVAHTLCASSLQVEWLSAATSGSAVSAASTMSRVSIRFIQLVNNFSYLSSTQHS